MHPQRIQDGRDETAQYRSERSEDRRRVARGAVGARARTTASTSTGTGTSTGVEMQTRRSCSVSANYAVENRPNSAQRAHSGRPDEVHVHGDGVLSEHVRERVERFERGRYVRRRRRRDTCTEHTK